MIWLARSIIFSDIVLSTLYIVTYKVTFPRLFGAILIALVLIIGFGKFRISKTTRSVMVWALALVTYKFLLDFTLHYTVGVDAVTQLLKELVVILMLPVFDRIGSNRIGIVRTVMVSAIPALILGMMQIMTPSFNVPELLPTNSLLITESITASYIHAESRIVGTYSIAIGYAILLAILCVIAWAYGLVDAGTQKRVIALMFIALCFVLMIFTQTRSAIYGVLPAMLVAYFLENPKSLKKNILLIAGVGILIAGFAGFQTFVTKYSERSEIVMDANTYYKLTANLYGTYAALHRNPLFGVPLPKSDDFGLAAKQQAEELIEEGRRALGQVVENKHNLKLKATNHNLFAFYLRHYGLIGFVLLMVVLVKIYKKILAKQQIRDRYMLLGVFVFFLQYSLLHNTQIFEYLLIWVLLAHGDEHVRAVGASMRIQRKARLIQSY